MSFGVMGAAMQPQGHVQVLSNIIDFGMNVQTGRRRAARAARWLERALWYDDERRRRGLSRVALRGRTSPRALAALGHRVERGRDGFGGYQAVLRDLGRGVYKAASESRKDGCAAGLLG